MRSGDWLVRKIWRGVETFEILDSGKVCGRKEEVDEKDTIWIIFDFRILNV